jgi:hypothetical protein
MVVLAMTEATESLAIAARADTIGDLVPVFACGAVSDAFFELKGNVTSYPAAPA